MNILLLCTGNSCRSQMAHGFLEKRLKGKVNIYSAGVEAHGVNPKSIIVMNEIRIDISKNTSNVMKDYINISFDEIFTLGNNAKKNCLDYKENPNKTHKLFLDPFNAKGTEEEILNVYRKVRDEIVEYFESYQFS